jgi:hypothetical protein
VVKRKGGQLRVDRKHNVHAPTRKNRVIKNRMRQKR